MSICWVLISEEIPRKISCKTSTCRIVDKTPFILRIFKHQMYQGHTKSVRLPGAGGVIFFLL